MRRLGDLESGGDGGLLARASVAPGKRTRTEAIQRRAARTGSAPTADTDERPSGSGAPLAEPARSRMEAGFGTDLSAVRVHEGSHVGALGAVAYAQGTDLHFAPGHYDPSSQRGQELIGHEVAHVMQQAEGRVAATTQYKRVDVNDDAGLEREADELGVRVARGEQVAQGWRLGGERATAAMQRRRSPIQRQAPGAVEHVNNSCYAASVITLLSRVGAYRQAFDPGTNVLEQPDEADLVATQRYQRARAVQLAVTPLLDLVAAGTRVTGEQIDGLVGVLHQAGITVGQRDSQQDAGQVLMQMLDLVIHDGNQGELATRSHEQRVYDDGALNDNAARPLLQLYADGAATLEDALRAEFPTDRHVTHGDDGVPLESPHRLSRHAVQLPRVLTLSVTRRNSREALDMPQIFTVPAEIAPGVDPLPRYRLAGFILRSHYGGGGGHYVSYTRDEDQWHEADDMGGGQLPLEQIQHNRKAATKGKPAVMTEPEVAPVGDLATARYGGLPAPSFSLGHIYTYERIQDDPVGEEQPRVGIGPVVVDPLPQPGAYPAATGGTGRSARTSLPTARPAPWRVDLDGKSVDLDAVSVGELLTLLDGGKLAEERARILPYLAARARHALHETLNYVPGHDPVPGASESSSSETSPELQLHRIAKGLALEGNPIARDYLRAMEYLLTATAPREQINDRTSEQGRDRYCEQQLLLPEVGQELTSQFIAWQKSRGEHLHTGALRRSGDTLTQLIERDGTPKQIVDQIIVECPELVEKYRVECASRGMTFYEHAQKVIGQYLKYFRHTEHPLVGVDAMVKMILFHDMDKKLANTLSSGLKKSGKRGGDEEPTTADPGTQAIERDVRGKGFSGLPTSTLAQRLNARKGKDAEHALTRIMMQKYGPLWSSVEESMLVTEMVDGDPIGELMKAIATQLHKRGASVNTTGLVEAAAHEIEEMAQRAGIARTDGRGLADFYRHVKMFYQADSSSYSVDGAGVPWEARTTPDVEPTPNDDRSQLNGLYVHGSGQIATGDDGYLTFADATQAQAIEALDAYFAARASASKGDTARDTRDDRQGWDAVPQFTWADFHIIAEIGKGSTKPLHVTDASGQHKFLKLGMHRDPIHVMTELLTNQLYQAIGAPVPGVELILIEGQPAMIAPWIEGFTSPAAAHEVQGSDDFLSWVSADFIFGNWDLFKLDNWQLHGDRMVRADNGGALDYRAQGDRKGEQDWEGGALNSQTSMRTFGATRKDDPYKDLTDRRVAYSVVRVADFLTEHTINQALETAHCPVHRRAYLRTTLLHRLGIMQAWAQEQIQYREVPITHVPQGTLEAFLDGLATMIHGGTDPGESGTTRRPTRAVPVDHGSDPFTTWARERRVDRRFLDDLRRMRHGVLIRKCAPQEAGSFARAATFGQDQALDRQRAIYGGRTDVQSGTRRDAWRRGETVFSVNRLYEFKREAANDNASDQTTAGVTSEPTQAPTDPIADQTSEPIADQTSEPIADQTSEPIADQTSEPVTGETSQPVPGKLKTDVTGIKDVQTWIDAIRSWDDASNSSDAPSLQNAVYTWVIELPISDQALALLEDTALIQGNSYAPEYTANHNLKYENIADGQLPNLVLREAGFQQIWECLDKVRVFAPDQHISSEPIPGSDEARRAREALIELERQARIAEAAARRQAANDNQSDSDDDDGNGLADLFGTTWGDQDDREGSDGDGSGLFA